MKNMHKVSDEDFDKLFRDKLYSYEAAPSEVVWTGIIDQLKTRRKEGSFPILRVAAASLASIIGLGIWLAANNEPMRLTGAADNAPVNQTTESPKSSVQPGSHVRNLQSTKPVTEEKVAVEAADIKDTKTAKFESIASQAATSSPAKVQTAAISNASTAKEVENAERPVSPALSGAKETPVLALAEDLPEDNEVHLREKKIKSVGSLVNFVVGKIDKRKSKIIEFEDGDEGTKVSGLNLGLVKFKARE